MLNAQGIPRQPLLLVILDGFGRRESATDNAIALADTPNLDRLYREQAHAVLEASGAAVGLPEGQMGNSEVGHMTLGSGVVVRQDLVRIDDAIADGAFFRNAVLLAALGRARARQRPIHLLGLVSDGGVHSHVNHLVALIRLCGQQGVRPLVHFIADGRDTPPKSALRYVAPVVQALDAAGGAIASVAGRFWAMDRDQRWERTRRFWDMLIDGGEQRPESAEAAISAAYDRAQTDEFIEPVMLATGEPLSPDDELIVFNFRKDRPRQIVAALALAAFDGFNRASAAWRGPIRVTCMMAYHAEYDLPAAFTADKPAVTLNRILAACGIAQFHCAETEKYPHVTYYFNGGVSDKAAGEAHALIPSPKVTTYDLQPAMSLPAVTDAVVDALRSGRFGFLVVNLANGDMVGHTGDQAATVQAVAHLDTALGALVAAAKAGGYSVIVTADHGNCEQMVDAATGEPHTQHTTHPVPLVVIDSAPVRLRARGGLADVAPTALALMGIAQPAAMTGRSMLVEPPG